MSHSALRYAIAAGFLLAAPAGALADGLQAGMWKVTNKPEVNGAPGPQAQNMKCLTADDVKDLDKTFSPVARTVNSACERVEHESTPQRLKWRLQCTGQLDMDVAGEYVFDTPEHYTATIVTSASMGGRVVQSSRVAIEAERVGECQ